MEGDDDHDVTAADTPRTRATHANLGALPSRFTVKQTLGEGGMGMVVEAYDRVLSRDVAIKVLSRDHIEDPSIGARFLREARAAARLRHPGIVQVHDIDPDGGFIVMELVRGEAMSVRLKRERKLPPKEVRRIGTALLEALAVAHAAGIVHRDVKPANVLLGEHGEIKLADFGVAFFGDSDLTIPGTRIGTPAYMAPEQLRGKDIDARADVYSAGVTLFEAATGKRIHDDDEAARDPYTLVLAATGDSVLGEAIARAVRERPGDRFADGAAFAAALELTDVPRPPPSAIAKPAVVPLKRARSRWPWLAATLAIAALGAGGYAYVRHRDKSVAAAAGHHAIALLPFVDASKNPLLDFAAAGLPNLLGLELHGVPGITVVGYYQLLGVAGQFAPQAAWVDAAKRLGADVIVRGEVTKGSGTGVHLSIVIETPGGVRMDSLERETPVEEVPEVIRRAAPDIVKIALGREIETGTHAPTAFAADRELQLGIAALDREHLGDAAEHLRAALHHQPDLAMAHYYLAAALSWDTPPAEPARQEIAKALATNQLDEAQRGFLGGIRYIVDQDFVGGIELLRPLSEKFPDDRDILYALFESLFHGGRPGEAMGVYRRIIKLAPKFRLALIHNFTFYIAHGDAAGMGWAVGLGDFEGDTYSRVWEPRILIGRREYGNAIKLLATRIGETSDPGLQHEAQIELATAYALADELELAIPLVEKAGEGNAGSVAPMMLGIANARGDAALRERWRAAQERIILGMPAGPSQSLAWMFLAATEIPVAPRAELVALAKSLDGSVVADYGRSLNLNLAQALLADAIDDTARLELLAKNPYPEVAGIAAAGLARRAGDREAAAVALRRSIAASGDARFLPVQWWRLAGELRAANDHAGVVAACDEAIRPRLFQWSWGSVVADCLQWTGDASDALGQHDAARLGRDRLLKLRPAK